MTYSQMLDTAGADINALLIMGADPASERSDWAKNLAGLDLLVVQELFLTETAQLADVVLPAVSWAECDGTFTNLERRVQRCPPRTERRANPKLRRTGSSSTTWPPAWASTGPSPMSQGVTQRNHTRHSHTTVG